MKASQGGKKSEPAKGTGASSSNLTSSKSEAKKGTPMASKHLAPRATTTAKQASANNGGLERRGRKPGKGSGKWGGKIDEELSLLDVEADEQD